MEYEEFYRQALSATQELVERSGIGAGSLLVVGCSSSEMVGGVIGRDSAPAAATAVVQAIERVLLPRKIALAAQCCEHLNRALIIERAYAQAHGLPIVCVVPYPKAGGSFATAAYAAMQEPVAVESVQADAGLDIGGTLIGMHLRPVAVPLRLQQNTIGAAHILSAYTRPKYIGGARAKYE